MNSRALTHHFHHHRSCCLIGAPILAAKLSSLSSPTIRAGGASQALRVVTGDHTRGSTHTSSLMVTEVMAMEMLSRMRLPLPRNALSFPRLPDCKRTERQLEKPSDTTSHGIIWTLSTSTPRKLRGLTERKVGVWRR